MTATQPDLRILAMGEGGVREWLSKEAKQQVSVDEECGRVLCEAPRDSYFLLHPGKECGLVEPGFVSDIALALAEAGIAKAGAAGVAELHRREVRALERANALARAVLDIGQVLRDAKRLAATYVFPPGNPNPSPEGVRSASAVMASAFADVTALVDSVNDDIASHDPCKRAREVLAAHGWATDASLGEALGGEVWRREDVAVMPTSFTPDVLRAFATLAEESRP